MFKDHQVQKTGVQTYRHTNPQTHVIKGEVEPVSRDESDLAEIRERKIREDLYLQLIRHLLHTLEGADYGC